MNKKVILILVDGMRADAVEACGSAYVPTLLQSSAYSLCSRTVMPSVTLPCHMSLFHSVDPDRHGITTNTYVPQVRPIDGLIERLDAAGKRCSMFYTWEQLRDLSRPGHLDRNVCMNLHHQKNADDAITDAAIAYINDRSPDFLFLYLGDTDEQGGHDSGWMSDTYMGVVRNAFACIERVIAAIPAAYDVMIIADHGGHGRSHGSDIPEDMTIPIICHGPSFEAGKDLGERSIKDIAPTIARMLGASPAREWEGRAL